MFSLIDKVPRTIAHVEVVLADKPSRQLGRIVRLGHLHGIVSANYLLLMAIRLLLCARVSPLSLRRRVHAVDVVLIKDGVSSLPARIKGWQQVAISSIRGQI